MGYQRDRYFFLETATQAVHCWLALPLVHFPKALKRPRNNAGPASNNNNLTDSPLGKQLT